MKIVGIVFGALLLMFMGIQLSGFWHNISDAQKNFSEMQAKLNNAKIDETELQNELNYYSEEANVEKELRARFNYKNPGEKMIIIVPPASTSAQTTSTPTQ